MRLVIHDLDERFNNKIRDKFRGDRGNIKIISDNGTIKNCIGCFGCWVKTPGECLINDGYNMMGSFLGKTDELIIISKCIYGTYSPFVKNVLDRGLSYVHPDFIKRNNEMHHKKRYDNRIKSNVYFYGYVNDAEKETAKGIVKANMLNFNGVIGDVKFFEHVEDILNESSID